MATEVEERAAYRPKNPGHFGPKVIGEDQYEAEKDMVETGAHIFGPKVIDSHPATDEDGGAKEPDLSDDKMTTVRDEGAGPSVGQFDLVGGQGGWYRAEHVASGLYLDEEGELVAERDDAKSFGQGEEKAVQGLRSHLQEVGGPAGREREVVVDQEAGPQATDPTPYETSEVEEAVRERLDEEGYLSLEDQEELLEEAHDALRDRIIDSEFGRADGVRREGLRNLIEAEKGREGGPRPDVLNRLERTWAQLTSSPES